MQQPKLDEVLAHLKAMNLQSLSTEERRRVAEEVQAEYTRKGMSREEEQIIILTTQKQMLQANVQMLATTLEQLKPLLPALEPMFAQGLAMIREPLPETMADVWEMLINALDGDGA